MDFGLDNGIKPEEVIIPPIRNTTSLEIAPENTEVCEIARNQLDNLSKIDRKPRKKAPLATVVPLTSSIDTDVMSIKDAVMARTDLVHDPSLHKSHNLSSAIVSKAELEAEIRKKVARQDSNEVGLEIGTIEIPHEMIMSRLSTTPTQNAGENAPQLHDQELIDILEGNPDVKSGDETEVFKVVHEEGRMVLVKDDASQESTSYEIVTEASEVNETKAKILEREIAMRQIASLPVRKNKKSTSAKSSMSPVKTIVQSLAEEWTDDDKEDDMFVELVNVEEARNEPMIKILNMTILNDAPEAKPKTISRPSGELPVKLEPKILNREAPKTAPKILNINASAGEPAASFKRSRVIKKKEIWDPSAAVVIEKKPVEKLAVSLPPSITIKKLTKESITKVQIPVESSVELETLSTVPTVTSKPAVKRFKKRSEIDKLLQDEGAVNMIYSLERENNNKDVAEISVIDKSQESSLITKTKAIKNVVMKQSSSPPEAKTPGRGRAKRDVTPVKTELEPPAVVTTKVPKTPSAGRKKKADNSWDYIYSQAQATCDDAMIIRRRSNSSYSSSAASPRRLSVDINETFDSPPPSAKKLKRDSKEAFEFTKPPLKNTKSPADKLLTRDFVEELRGKISNVITKNKEKQPAPVGKGRKRAAAIAESSATPAKRASERRANGSDHKEYRLIKEGKVAHIIINQTPLSIALMSEMKIVLNQLESDECQVVLITSSEGFSGLDYSTLVQTTVDKRKQAASDLVTAFK